jgi:glycosyltransferase involved in cell wall biosynthesis
MHATHVLMLLSNAYRPDPRVRKEALALIERGYHVTVIAWDRLAELAPEELDQGIHIIRVQSAISGYGSGARQLFRIPRFWRAAVQLGMQLRLDAVHCHDLDTLPAGWSLKRRLGIPLVYDAHEDYPALMSLYLPRPLTAGLSLLERWLVRSADATLTASTVLAGRFCEQGIAPVTVIPNVPELGPFEAITPAQVRTARQSFGLDDGTLVVAYIGGFSRNRELLPLIAAGKGQPGVEILLWGDGHQRKAVEQAVAGASNVRYLGWLPAEQVPLMTCVADAIYYCLASGYPGAVYNAPNTLSNAMAAGRPILGNRVGDLGRIVLETGCGLLVDPVSPPAIRQAIRELADPELRDRLGAAGQQAARKVYNWNVVKGRLGEVYEVLLGKSSV